MRSIRPALLRWYRRSRRDLPWRRTRDPYAIWISEAMLQQTRVETVIPYYERFLTRFPDVGTLACSDLDDVLGQWAGLGYYSRARNLHAAAQEVMERFDGSLPKDAAGLRSLPGIGRYTAGAIASIAFDRAEPVLDGNVIRVLARFHGIRDDVRRPAVAARLWEEAAALCRGPHPGDLNQALMELGARVCTPRAPDCSSCPLSGGCAARRAGEPESIPSRAPRSRPRQVRAVAALLVRRGRTLMVRRPHGGLLGGLWELPGGELAHRERPEVALRRTLRDATGLSVHALEPVGRVTHLFSHRELQLHVFRGCASPGRIRLAGFEEHRWIAPARLGELSQARLTRKALAVAVEDR